MEKKLESLIRQIGKKKPDVLHVSHDFGKISARLHRYNINLKDRSLRRIWRMLTMKERLPEASLNRLALFAGFQSWHDLQKALHGDSDAQLNYK